VVVRFKAWLRGCSIAGISGSNTAEGMNVLLFCLLCIVRGDDHTFWGALPFGSNLGAGALRHSWKWDGW
jgi:hypothetical protein